MNWKEYLLETCLEVILPILIYFFEICLFAITMYIYPSILDKLPIWSSLVMFITFLVPPILIVKVFQKILQVK
jgi:hypothetical protein